MSDFEGPDRRLEPRPSQEDKSKMHEEGLKRYYADLAGKLTRGEMAVTEFADFLTERQLSWEKLADHDYLTGLLNRKKGSEVIQKLIDSGKPCGIAELDIDHFKIINDKYGHPDGDVVLKEVAAFLKDMLGEELVARWGGEEFMMMLPGLQGKELADRVEEIGKNLSEKVSHKVGKEITVSIGAVGFLGEEDMDKILDRVDEMLYKAKRNNADGTSGRRRGMVDIGSVTDPEVVSVAFG